MNLLLTLVLFFNLTAAFSLLLHPNLVRNLFGVAILGNGINLGLFLLGYDRVGSAPIIEGDKNVLGSLATDPVPQALILTAIVIGFAMLAFLSTMLLQARRSSLEHEDLK